MINKMKGLILEGIAGTGKTTTLEILERLRGKKNISLFCENQTRQPLEQYTDITKVAHSDLFDSLIATARNIGKDYIFDRFHLTSLYVHHDLVWADFRGIEKDLIQLNAKICILTINKEDIRSRILDDYKTLGYEKLLLRYGRTKTEQIENYWTAQMRLMDLMRESVLPVLVINTSKTGPEKVAHEAMSFWSS